jgi:hypothetical protein
MGLSHDPGPAIQVLAVKGVFVHDCIGGRKNSNPAGHDILQPIPIIGPYTIAI